MTRRSENYDTKGEQMSLLKWKWTTRQTHNMSSVHFSVYKWSNIHEVAKIWNLRTVCDTSNLETNNL